jgi:tetratricopeptide (TPR) repeat protein
MRIGALIVACLIAAASPALGAVPDASQPSADAPYTPSARELKAAHLDKLFADLKAAPTIYAGKEIEAQIWAEWLRSGDSDTDQVMDEVLAAMNSQDLKTALKYLDAIVQSQPDYAEGWNKRATVFFYLNDYPDSLADIDKVLALEPRHFGALSGLGMIKMNEGDKRGALDAFQRAYAVDPALNNIKNVIDQLKAALGKDI